MADTPALSDLVKRKLALQWEALRQKHKLTDEDLSGYDRKRQQLTEVSSKWPRHDPRHRDPRYATQVARSVGLTPSVNAATARFRGTDWEHWLHWCSTGAGYEAYVAWLECISRSIMAELESIWKGRSDVTDRWFEQTCKPEVGKALSALIKGRIAQALEVEINRLDQKAGLEARAPARTAEDLVGLFRTITKNTSIEKWAKKNHLSRTAVFNWKAAHEGGKSLRGKVSPNMAERIEEAIRRDAQSLGLMTRIGPDAPSQ